MTADEEREIDDRDDPRPRPEPGEGVAEAEAIAAAEAAETATKRRSEVPGPAPTRSDEPPSPRVEEADQRFHGTWLVVLGLGIVATAVVGFVTGTRGDQDPYRRPRNDAPEAPAGALGITPSYADIREDPLGPNRDRHAGALAAMRAAHPGVMDEGIPPRDDEAVRAELARRAELRAYNGAPPRIPHPIAPRGPLDCVGCHLEGMRVDEHVAPPMSHSTDLQSCTQCHVPNEGQMPGARLEGGPPTDNRFEGMQAPLRGPRMWPGAPPQMPHTTRMRERCDSCHGVWGQGIRSTHPWRRSCRQCHAPSATHGQQPRTLEGGPPAAPMPGQEGT